MRSSEMSRASYCGAASFFHPVAREAPHEGTMGMGDGIDPATLEAQR
jgi:hypothetical protein